MSAVEISERCGTTAEYQAHLKRGETPCTECREAKRIYMQNRRTDSDRRKHEKSLEAARLRALWRLARKYRDEFRALYAEESADLVPPPRPVRVAECHPERKHAAKGLCATCYRRMTRSQKREVTR